MAIAIPAIIFFHASIHTRDIYIVMERPPMDLATLTEDAFRKQSDLRQQEVMRGVLALPVPTHERGIAHRDLKPPKYSHHATASLDKQM
jgi:hypothetical protein